MGLSLFLLSPCLTFGRKEQKHFFDLVEKVATATKGIYAKPPLKGAERRLDLKGETSYQLPATYPSHADDTVQAEPWRSSRPQFAEIPLLAEVAQRKRTLSMWTMPTE